MRRFLTVCAVFGAGLSVGCASSNMSVVAVPQGSPKAVAKLAIAPGSGVFGDAIAIELFNAGLVVVDAAQTSGIIGRAGLQEFEVATQQGYSALHGQGIDAVLVARAVAAGDGTPESASVRVMDTQTGQLIAGLTWQNGRGGQRGSIADRTMRKNLSEAAREIARELLKQIRLG